MLLRHLFSGVGNPTIDGIAVSSVVPPTDAGRRRAGAEAYLGVVPLIVGPGVRTGMPILYDDPQQVGSDRVVNAVAAYERTRDTTIVVDCGTATKLEYVTHKGEYIGGIIAPGLGIASDALFERAARCTGSSWRRPKHVVGRNTVHAIQSGLIYGYVSLIDGLVVRMQKEIGMQARVIATGGFATLLAPESDDHRRGRRVPDSRWIALDLCAQLWPVRQQTR